MTVWLRQHMAAAIAVAAVCLALGLVAATLGLLWHGRREAIATHSAQATRFVHGAEAALNRALLAIDLVLAGGGDLLEPALRSDGSLDPEIAARSLRGLRQRQLAMRDLALVSDEGEILAAAQAGSLRLGMAFPKAFVHDVAAQAVPQLAVSAPMVNAATSEWTLYLARPLTLRGARRGVMVAEVPVSSLAAILGQGIDTTALSVTLEREDGKLLVSVPPNDALMGGHVMPPLTGAGRAEAVFEGPGRLDGEPALMSVRPSLYRSLFIAVGIPMHNVLAEWRFHRDVVVGVSAAVAVLVVVLSGLIRWHVARLTQARREVACSKATLDQALAAMADGFLLRDAQDRVVSWNARFLALFPWVGGRLRVGVGFAELVAHAPADEMGDRDKDERKAWIEFRLAVHREGGTCERLLHDGTVFQGIERHTADGGSVCVFRDITARWQAEQALKESEARMRTVADALPMAVAYIDTEQRYRFNNLTYGRRFRRPLKDIYGKTMREFLGEETYAAILPHVQAALRGETVTYQNSLEAGGDRVWYEAHYVPQFTADGNRVLGFHAVITNITQQKLHEQRLIRLAQVDALTGMVNRAGFELRLADAMAHSAATGELMALMYLDIDRFKQINDRLGHATGDALLIAFARRLSQALRTSDTVARLGGDEFTLLMQGLSAREDAIAIADKIIQAMHTPFALGEQRVEVGASIGVAFYQGDATTPADLLKQADEMLYRAKAAGRNNYQVAAAA